ncbi:MAG: LCP family protein [Bacilli bacterium]
MSKRTRNWIIALSIIIFLPIIIVGGYFLFVVSDKYDDVVTERPGGNSSYRPAPVTPKSNAISILVMGVETYSSDGVGGRADSLMLATLDPDKNTMNLLSIPRDTRVLFPDRGEYDKINHAYAFGGDELTIQSVETLLHVPVDYFVRVDFDGFKRLVDAIGGVTVDVPFNFSTKPDQNGRPMLDYYKGKQTLNGEQALGYVRMRKEDPDGDFGRAARQREVIVAVMEKLLRADTIVTRFSELLDIAGDHVRTNITFSDASSLATQYSNLANGTVKQLTMDGEGYKIDGIYYFIPDEIALYTLTQELRTFLGMEE